MIRMHLNDIIIKHNSQKMYNNKIKKTIQLS